MIHDATKGAYRRDLTGQRFARLTAVDLAEPATRSNGTPIRRWNCVCDCGSRLVVRQNDLTSGRSRSCGCFSREKARETGAARRQPLAGYASAHRRVQSDRGKAAEHPCVDCGATAADWSYDGLDPDERVEGTLVYSLKTEHYWPRCRSCHLYLDRGVSVAP